MAVNLVNVTTINRARLYQGQPGISVATVYTVPASTDVKVTSIQLCNVALVPGTVTLSVVPSGGTAGVTNRILNTFPVNASDTVTIETSIYMTTSDFIAALQGTAAAITATISGETYA